MAVRSDGYSTRPLKMIFPELKEFLSTGARVLDVGCGPGTITLGVAEVVDPGRVFGLDMSEGTIADAREKADSASVTNVEFIVDDACSLPFEHGASAREKSSKRGTPTKPDTFTIST